MAKAKPPTAAQRRRWERIAAYGCMICGRQPHIHHALTGGGGRKDHDQVLPLCYLHHQGKEGIHTMSRRKWEQHFGVTETELLQQIKIYLNEE